MKTLYKKASQFRTHTWKDIGGLGGMLLDGAFFAFLLFISLIVVTIGAVVVALDYVASPVLSLISLCSRPSARDRDDAVLQEDGTLAHRPAVEATTPTRA